MTPRVADLFAGIGGATLAFRRAGFAPVFASEIDPRAADTYAANHVHRPAGDVAGINPADVPDHDVAFIGLPCVGFSTLGRRKGFADPRESCWYSALRIVARKRPAAVVVENVAGFARNHGGAALRFVRSGLRAVGYRTAWRVLDAAVFGGAQVRRRVFVVGARGRRFDFDRLATAQPGRIRDVLAPEPGDEDPKPGDGDLPRSEYVLLDRPYQCQSGPVFAGYLAGRPLWTPGGRLDRPRTHRHLHRIYGDEGLAPTLTAQGAGRRLWVRVGRRVRRLNLTEWARLQGFTDDYLWPDPAKARNQLGNSVHVPTVAELARQIRLQLL